MCMAMVKRWEMVVRDCAFVGFKFGCWGKGHSVRDKRVMASRAHTFALTSPSSSASTMLSSVKLGIYFHLQQDTRVMYLVGMSPLISISTLLVKKNFSARIVMQKKNVRANHFTDIVKTIPFMIGLSLLKIISCYKRKQKKPFKWFWYIMFSLASRCTKNQSANNKWFLHSLE